MPNRRTYAGLLAAIALAGTTVASASSLGSFDEATLEGYLDAVSPCQAATTTMSNGGVPVPLGPVALVDLLTVDGLTGDCEGLTPVVVVIGSDFATAAAHVHIRQEFGSPIGAGATSAAEAAGVELSSLLATNPTAVISEIRVAFVPVAP